MRTTLKEHLAQHPELAAQYSPQNHPTTLNKSTGSNHKAWWVCQHYGCDYQKAIYAKIKNPDSCSVCNGSTVFPGYNDLATVLPHLAAEWDSSKNTVSPSEVKHSTGKLYWFVCPDCAHSYKASPAQRAHYGSGCSKCGHRRKAETLTGDPYRAVKDCDDDMSAMFRGEGNPSRKSPVPVPWECAEGHCWVRAPRGFDGCPVCAGGFVGEGGGMRVLLKQPQDTSIAGHATMNRLYAATNTIPPTHISTASARTVHWECPNGHTWQAPPYSIKKSVTNNATGCPHCHPLKSATEQEIADFIRETLPNTEVLTNDRTAIAPKELDIYLPELGVAIEYNGLYWHTEQHQGRYGHAQKLAACQQAGIRLIVIWEDDWAERKQTVKNMLQHKLEVSRQPRTPARTTTLKEVTAVEARAFAEQNHIQGFTPGSLYLGLTNRSDELVALSIWRKQRETLYLERYCTSAIVSGGLGRMLKHAKTWAEPRGVTSITTFSDHTVSDGKLYQDLGFEKGGVLRPDYSYLVQGRRQHKFNYRKKRFKNDASLLYREGATETELAELNAIPRIWDYGKTKWEIKLPEKG